jgi:hypothetical protein
MFGKLKIKWKLMIDLKTSLDVKHNSMRKDYVNLMGNL